MAKKGFDTEQDNCPECKVSWFGEDLLTIAKKHRDVDKFDWMVGQTDKELMDHIKENYKPPYKDRILLSIEIQGQYDGTSFYKCPECKTYWDRFTGEIATSFDKKY